MKAPFVIYANMESLHEKIDTCQRNPEKSSTKRKFSEDLKKHATKMINYEKKK